MCQIPEPFSSAAFNAVPITSRENDPNPVLWLAGQDYRAADATHTARAQPARARHGPERVGHER